MGSKEQMVTRNCMVLAMILGMVCSTQAALAQSAGADTFKAKCQMCHGVDGLGQTPAGRVAKIVSLKDPAVVNAKDADLMEVVKKGKNKMPSFAGKLTDEQIQAAIAYIRTLEK